jgi:hypothetical protein
MLEWLVKSQSFKMMKQVVKTLVLDAATSACALASNGAENL